MELIGPSNALRESGVWDELCPWLSGNRGDAVATKQHQLVIIGYHLTAHLSHGCIPIAT